MSKLLRIVFTVILLLLVVYITGLFGAEKRQELWNVLRNPNWFWLIVCILVGILINFASAFKWWMLTQSAGLKAGLGRIYAYYLIGAFYNLVLPTSVGGDVVRAYELGKYTKNQAMSLASVFVERYTGIVMLLLLSIIAVILNLRIFNEPLITISLGLFTIALAVIGWMAINSRLLKLAKRLFAHWHSFIAKVLDKIEKLHQAVLTYRSKRGALAWAMVNSFVFYILAVLNVFTTAKVFDLGVDLNTIIIATPVIMLLMNIPLSIGNHGIMEFAFTMTFELLGLGAILGLSTAILLRLKSVIDGLIGGLCLFILGLQDD